jgi:hypothetical protein
MIRLDYSYLNNARWGKGCFAEDYLLLAGIVANLQPRTVLEIGTSVGLGAVVIASALPNVQVTTIDPNQSGVDSNVDIVPGVRKRIKFVQATSDRAMLGYAAKGQRFDLVFIDGDHSRTQAAKDWIYSQDITDTWVLHDTTQFTGLQELVRMIRQSGEFDAFQFLSAPGHRCRRRKWKREGFITGMTIVQKRKQLDILPGQVHRGDDGKLLRGHGEDVVPNLKTVFG